ncbi:MAG: hypothetical protein FGM24_10890, partial [Candidatus Kapabacteria bacterium]|nr:hypothetical protein [Candidatus Kapabacteria bacterium]
MAPTWTPSQLAALARDRHIVVTANAGAGKTAVLTERFLRIILDDQVDLGRVVAITFTNKAAAEMRARIGTALRAVAEDSEAPSARRQRARSALNRISTARISTFHAFCGTLLRTYADEANLEADVRELLPRETSALINDAISATVRAWMRDDARRDRLLALTDELGILSVQQSIASLVSSSERLRAARAWRDGFASANDVLLHRQQIVVSHARTAWTSAAQNCLDAMLQAGATLKPKGVGTVNALRSALQGIASAQASTLPQAAAAMQAAIDMAITSSKGTLRKDLFEKSGTKTSDATVLSTSRQKNLTTLTKPWSSDLERLQVVLADTILDVAYEASKAYAESKRARNGLDFDDLILRSIELLEGNAVVANDVRRNIEHLMIDEFQDTNPAQFQLVSCLVPDIAQAASSERNDSATPCPWLFIVGDGKQSIYGFRDADVRLFERAAQAIDAANARSGMPSGRVKLLASFRMAPACAVAINAICSEIVIRQSEFDVDYDALVCGRPNVPDGVGSCNVIVTDVTQQRSLPAASDDDDDDTLAAIEAAHVADVIARTISDPAHTLPIQVKTGESRPATAGDIAVLVRGNAGAAAIADALRKRNVRCHVLAGRGFFTRPEIADIRNLLRWSTDRLDDLACMALMR